MQQMSYENFNFSLLKPDLPRLLRTYIASEDEEEEEEEEDKEEDEEEEDGEEEEFAIR